MVVFFFFQAEDGIRDLIVTGVQTCALPIFDSTFAPLVKAIAPACPTVKRWVQMCDEAAMPAEPSVAGCLNYEALIKEASAKSAGLLLEENAASVLCYTSATTGNPKGALY